MEFYMFGAGMLFLGVLLGVVGIAVYKSQVNSPVSIKIKFLQTLVEKIIWSGSYHFLWPNTCGDWMITCCQKGYDPPNI